MNDITPKSMRVFRHSSLKSDLRMICLLGVASQVTFSSETSIEARPMGFTPSNVTWVPVECRSNYRDVTFYSGADFVRQEQVDYDQVINRGDEIVMIYAVMSANKWRRIAVVNRNSRKFHSLDRNFLRLFEEMFPKIGKFVPGGWLVFFCGVVFSGLCGPAYESWFGSNPDGVPFLIGFGVPIAWKLFGSARKKQGMEAFDKYCRSLCDLLF